MKPKGERRGREGEVVFLESPLEWDLLPPCNIFSGLELDTRFIMLNQSLERDENSLVRRFLLESRELGNAELSFSLFFNSYSYF